MNKWDRWMDFQLKSMAIIMVSIFWMLIGYLVFYILLLIKDL